MERFTASSTVWFAPPPRDMLATAGLRDGVAWTSLVTQSMPAITPAKVPEPAQFRTRTATSFTSFATPYLVPPTVPATWVPWPLQSVESSSLSTVSRPWTARPAKSLWVVRMPVSMM
jgi:hypothetical protein